MDSVACITGGTLFCWRGSSMRANTTLGRATRWRVGCAAPSPLLGGCVILMLTANARIVLMLRLLQFLLVALRCRGIYTMPSSSSSSASFARLPNVVYTLPVLFYLSLATEYARLGCVGCRLLVHSAVSRASCQHQPWQAFEPSPSS